MYGTCSTEKMPSPDPNPQLLQPQPAESVHLVLPLHQEGLEPSPQCLVSMAPRFLTLQAPHHQGPRCVEQGCEGPRQQAGRGSAHSDNAQSDTYMVGNLWQYYLAQKSSEVHFPHYTALYI